MIAQAAYYRKADAAWGTIADHCVGHGQINIGALVSFLGLIHEKCDPNGTMKL